MKLTTQIFRNASSILLFVPCLAAFSQNQPAAPSFEAADVKANKSGETRMAIDFQPGGRFTARNAPLKVLIALAYQVRPETIQGAPGWIESERYDVVAKAPQGATSDAIRGMMQALLAERFKLAVHTDRKPMPAFALVTAKGGSKMPQAEDAPLAEQRCIPGDGAAGQKHVVCRHMPMTLFAAVLQEIATHDIDVPVVDQTGLKGPFDFKLDWTPTAGSGSATPDDAPAGPTLFDAVEAQLGLKLERRALPLPVIVVDAVERVPAGN
jgi:uncharacterized protein (TIGR03435 family)